MSDSTLKTNTDELPAGLAWSNSLARIDGVGLLARAQDEFRKLLEENPNDEGLRARVRGYVTEIRADLEELPDTERMLAAVGHPDDICGSETVAGLSSHRRRRSLGQLLGPVARMPGFRSLA